MVEEGSGEDEELVEEEDEFVEENVEKILEDSEGFEEVSDFSIGDIGLTTAKVESSWKGANLEMSLVEEPLNEWEGRHEKLVEEEENYKGVDDKTGRGYGSEFYNGNGQRKDLYSKERRSGTNVEGGKLYDSRAGTVSNQGDVRQADLSKLELVGLRKEFGPGGEKDIGDRKYD
ncbi:hypothetical protein KAJ38_01815 [Candidatus Pacearchaeota archaeon]|nr:hypothetical protein [Candidatus Pacearchaeota archaeon]